MGKRRKGCGGCHCNLLAESTVKVWLSRGVKGHGRSAQAIYHLIFERNVTAAMQLRVITGW